MFNYSSTICWIALRLLSEISWAYFCGSISVFSILFPWSTCLSHNQYHRVLIPVDIWCILKLGRLITLTVFFFFFWVVLAFLVLSPVHINIRIILSTHTEVLTEILIRIALFYINLERLTSLLCWIFLPSYEHKTLHLFSFPLIHFISVL